MQAPSTHPAGLGDPGRRPCPRPDARTRTDDGPHPRHTHTLRDAHVPARGRPRDHTSHACLIIPTGLVWKPDTLRTTTLFQAGIPRAYDTLRRCNLSSFARDMG